MPTRMSAWPSRSTSPGPAIVASRTLGAGCLDRDAALVEPPQVHAGAWPCAAAACEHGVGVPAACRQAARRCGTHVAAPVAVDVAQTRHREAGVVARAGAVDLEPALAEAAQVEGRARTQRPPHEVGGARLGPPARVVDERAHEHVPEPVVVDVARGGDRIAGVVANRLAPGDFALEAA